MTVYPDPGACCRRNRRRTGSTVARSVRLIAHEIEAGARPKAYKIARHELGAFFGALPLLSLAPAGDGHPVLVLPGLVASDVSTRALRTFLKTRGYAVCGWQLGAISACVMACRTQWSISSTN